MVREGEWGWEGGIWRMKEKESDGGPGDEIKEKEEE